MLLQGALLSTSAQAEKTVWDKSYELGVKMGYGGDQFSVSSDATIRPNYQAELLAVYFGKTIGRSNNWKYALYIEPDAEFANSGYYEAGLGAGAQVSYRLSPSMDAYGSFSFGPHYTEYYAREYGNFWHGVGIELCISLGAHYYISPNSSVDMAARCMHTSNGRVNYPNPENDDLYFVAGYSYYY